jgi:biotin carboxylase
MTKTILVLGTNAGQADLIRHMKSIGWRVIGCAPNKGEPGQPFCDVVEHVNIVDLDALEQVAKRHAVDLVYSISSDVAIRSVVALSERLGLPHFYDSAFIDLLDDKAALRAFLNDRGISPVPFAKVGDPSELQGWTHFPCMVKPTDAQGQRGVQRIDRPEDLEAAIARAIPLSRSKQAIVEGFLHGIEVSCNVLVCGGETRIRVLSERLVHGPIYPGVPRGHLIPAVNVPPDARQDAVELVETIISAMGHRDGVLYFQMIMTPEGPRVVEIAPRLDGCHMWRLIKASHGIDLLARAVDCLTGTPVSTSETPLSGGDRPMELMFQQMAPGTVFASAQYPAPPDATHHEYRYADGDEVRPVNGLLEVVGYYVRAMG